MGTFEVCMIIAFIIWVLFCCYQFFIIAEEIEKIWEYIEMMLSDAQRMEVDYKKALKTISKYVGIDFKRTDKLRKDLGYYEKKDI